jgi:DNA repair protein RadC
VSKDSSFTVRDLPRQERPRERLQKFGPEALSGQELLAPVIGRGIPKKSVMNIAQELLAKFGNIRESRRSVQARLNQETLKEIVLPILPRAVQQKIADLVYKSHEARKEAKDFLEKAKREVEEVIEKNQLQ